VSRFVITIAPDNGDVDDSASAQTTVRVDTSSGQTRITELTIKAADGGGLAPADLPAVDLELLIRALAAQSSIQTLPATDVMHLESPANLAETVEPSEVAAEPTVEASRPAAETQTATRKAPGRKAAGRKAAAGKAAAGKAAGRKAGGRAAGKKAEPSKAAGRGSAGVAARTGRKAAKAAAAKATGAKAAGTKATGTKATGAKAAGAKATRGGRKAAAAGQRETRAYRRMPEPAEVLAAYARAGSITGLAQHYGVPRHTANGWARRLRNQGHAIGRS
jgi:hypothetical protein